MNLTPKILDDAAQYIGPTKELVLDLRDKQLNSLLTLDSLKTDIYTVWDLSNNEISFIPEISPRERVRTILLAGNKLVKIPSLSWAINLETLSLINNEISSFDELLEFKNLQSIYLIGNPIKDYRLKLIKMIPTLKVIDFQKVKESERNEAFELEASIINTNLTAKNNIQHLDIDQIKQATTLDQLESLENLL